MFQFGGIGSLFGGLRPQKLPHGDGTDPHAFSAGSRTRPVNTGTRNQRGLTRTAQDSSRHTKSEAFQALKGLCDICIHTVLNLECCKCARMGFNRANCLVVLRNCAIAHLRGNAEYTKSGSAKQPYNENHGQWKRYKRHIVNVSITPVICNALMMITGVIETFAICRLYRFHWPWFSL